MLLATAQLARLGVMEAVARPRPDRAHWATRASGFSFPSGHATASALVAGLLCCAIAGRLGPGAARWACAPPVLWALAVGLTRIYLGVHWLGDVIGGWLFAAFWLTAAGCLSLLPPARTPDRTEPPAPGRGDP